MAHYAGSGIFCCLLHAHYSVSTFTPSPCIDVCVVPYRLGDRVLLAGDEVTYDWEAMAAPWINCAQELEASIAAAGMLDNETDTSSPPRSVKWLLISDNAFLKSWALQQYPEKLIQGSHEAVSYFLEYNLHSGAIDNWLFGLTDYQVISELSHFGRTAALRSHGNSSVFTVYQYFSDSEEDVRPAEGYHRSCDIADPDEPAHMMRLWYQL